jgi:type VI secretion system protein ImpE
MTQSSAAEQALRDGDAPRALKLLTEQVRTAPNDVKLRIFLFQLLCVLGQWDRALNQLTVASELDVMALPMAQTYREAIHCETLRLQVFAGQKVPMLFGEPEPWVALLIEALLREGRGDHDDGRKLREQALDQAPATAGHLNDQPFEWIADADTRLGPVLEAVINGRYCWVPYSRVAKLTMEAPEDLRDAVWMPANLQFTNGGEVVALIPTRYPDTELASGDLCALARRTEWKELPSGLVVGLGQRLLATDSAEFALMDVRSVVLAAADA